MVLAAHLWKFHLLVEAPVSVCANTLSSTAVHLDDLEENAVNPPRSEKKAPTLVM